MSAVIEFVTGNEAKYETARRAFVERGFVISRRAINLIEPQHDDVETIVRAKLAQCRPADDHIAVVEDTAIGFPALNGFPGTYVKHVHAALGNARILTLMRGEQDRTARIDSVCGAIDGRTGTVATTRTVRTDFCVGSAEQAGADSGGWSSLWQILELAPGRRADLLEPTSIEKMAVLLERHEGF